MSRLQIATTDAAAWLRSERWASWLAGRLPRVAVAQLAAFVATVMSVLVDVDPADGLNTPAALVITAGICSLRILSVRRSLTASTIALDGLGTALILAGTGAPTSSFFFLAVAGAWWAAHVPRRNGGLVYAVAFTVSYAPLVLGSALERRLLVQGVEDVATVIIVALLAQWLVRIDRRALQLNEALQRVPFSGDELHVREGLVRALGPVDTPIDVMLAAAQRGLTVIQAELLAYLVMGLSNQEIADATGVSEATVRYRLTRLYRALGVRGRREAARLAGTLGLEALTRPAIHS